MSKEEEKNLLFLAFDGKTFFYIFDMCVEFYLVMPSM